MDLKAVLKNQYSASLEMFKEAVTRCLECRRANERWHEYDKNRAAGGE